ncbi:hypothetical protein AB0L85_14660 [Streptomyces sp. NPDC052051]|uniref:hypothetical protein n=1 Tax=Streptomyces sp. NPDC052051 TaxID=3154649 RepID=UPI00343B6A33
MPRVRIALATLTTAIVGMAALTACSSDSDSTDSTQQADKPAAAPKPITKELSQAHLTQALLDDGETLPHFSLHGHKSVTDGEFCNAAEDADSAPKGWVRGSDSSYEYDGSTLHMADIKICLFDSADAAHQQYTLWKGTETSKQQSPKKPLGDENTLVVEDDGSVYGYVRSGKVNIRVHVDEVAASDPSGTQAMLAATLKRLQQLQDGKAATVTALDEQAAARQ